MKKWLPFLIIIFCGCASQKQAIDNTAVLNSHPSPIKIFGIGYYGRHYVVLTLTDAGHNYFYIRTLRNDSLKTGDVYKY